MKSEKKFRCLYRFLVFLFICEIIVGLAIAIICEFVKELLQGRTFQFDKHEALSVFFVVKLFGLHVAFYFLCGIPLILMFNDVYTRHMGALLKLWLVLAVETSMGALAMIWCFADALNFLMEDFERSLKEGLNLYPENPVWVLIWDDLQYDYKCCGVYSHNDWVEVNLTMSPSKQFKHKKNFSWLPYSCAKGNMLERKSFSDDNIHTEGCFNVISRTIDCVRISTVSLHVAIVVLMV